MINTPQHLIDLEEEIEKLSADANGSKSRLEELKTELEKINKKKEEYVAEHPEHRKLVYRQRRDFKEKEKEDEAPIPQTRNLFKKNGLPRHPERSIYYDPILNPFGVPPPGMPYVERRMCHGILIIPLPDLVQSSKTGRGWK